MKPTHDSRGRSCLVSSVATVTELPPGSLPHFIRRPPNGGWLKELRTWADANGWTMEVRSWPEPLALDELPGQGWRGYWIGVFTFRHTSNGALGCHAVVMRGSRIAFDVWPDDGARQQRRHVRFGYGIRLVKA